MQNNYNQQQQSHALPTQQFQNGPPVAYMQQTPPTTPTRFQNSGNFPFMQQSQQQHQLANTRAPVMGGSNMPQHNPNFGNINPQAMAYSQSQPNSPSTVKPQGTGSELVHIQNQGPASTPTAGTQAAEAQRNQQQGPIAVQQQAVPQKEFNAASFCRLGQETVQEFVNKIHEMFGTLKSTQPPDGKLFAAGIDRKQKLHEMLRAVKVLLKRLRIIYDKVEEAFPSPDTMDAEVQNMIPYLSEREAGSVKPEDMEIEAQMEARKNTEAYRLALEEYQEVQDQVTMKNRQLKEVIDHLRQIIWDINTMLAVRKD